MRIVETPRFTKELADLPEPIKARAKKQLALFVQNHRHPSLQIEKMEGFSDIWKGRITQKYRFTFQIEGDAYVLRRIGPHDIERSP